MEKKCISCGMPLTKKEHFPNEDETKDFCVYCADDNGNLRPYDQVVENMAQFFAQMKNIDIEKAKDLVKEYMKEMPAWKDKA